MFLLDGSPSIGASEFEEMKNFVRAFIESADISMCLSFLLMLFCSQRTKNNKPGKQTNDLVTLDKGTFLLA